MAELTATAGRLRPMERADTLRLLAWRNDESVRRFMYTQQVITLQEHTAWIERCLQDPRKHLLIYEAEQQPRGFVNLSALARGKVADWGFYAAPDAPKGSGSALCAAALHYSFATLGLHKVCGQVLSFNLRSLRLHEALGFQREGLLREHEFDGERYLDVVCFGLLREEWQAKMQNIKE